MAHYNPQWANPYPKPQQQPPLPKWVWWTEVCFWVFLLFGVLQSLGAGNPLGFMTVVLSFELLTTLPWLIVILVKTKHLLTFWLVLLVRIMMPIVFWLVLNGQPMGFLFLAGLVGVVLGALYRQKKRHFWIVAVLIGIFLIAAFFYMGFSLLFSATGRQLQQPLP